VVSQRSENIQRWREHPDQFVREVFHVTPDPIQDQILKIFPTSPRIAMKASKGTGKTCTEAWLCWNFLLTRPHPKIACTSISSDNLADGLWTEMARWQNESKLLRQTFMWTKTRIFSKDHPETWWMSARTWSQAADKQKQSATLAGLHADYIMFVIDESGGVPDAVMASAEAALASGIESHLVQGGNPTHLEGPLYRACTDEKSLWKVFEMTGDPDNPARSPRVDIQWARDQISKYGKDNPWVLVNVFGMFPPSSMNALIGPDELHAAVQRKYREPDFQAHPMILGVDVARYGDDSSIIFPRQGLQAFNPFQYRGLNGTQGAEVTINKWNELSADACFIDNTGGFGASWIDNIQRLGKSPIGIHFSQEPVNPKYFNKRAEMVFDCVEWIKRGGSIPDIPELIRALTVTTYTFNKDKIIIEPKDDIKVKLNGMSPDHMDALILTFALPVEKEHRNLFPMREQQHEYEYNPFSRDRVRI
jgi:phage terminase large subunit